MNIAVFPMIAIEESAALLIIYPNYLYTIIIKGFYFLCAQTEKGEKILLVFGVKEFYIIEVTRSQLIFNLGYERVYVAGDTDVTPEILKIKCDLAFLPVGGTYTMDYAEAAKLANILKPAIAVPIHYGKIVGSIQDAKNFKCLLNNNIECKIMI